jgi:hypothetical protein
MTINLKLISLAVVCTTLLLFNIPAWPQLKPVYALPLSDQLAIKLLASPSDPSAFFLPPSSSSIPQSNATNSTTGAGPEVKFLPYENSTYGIRIQYPSNWIKQESQNQSSNLIVGFKSPPGNGFAYITIERGGHVPQNISLEQFSNATINELRQSFPGFNLTESNSTTLAGIPAHEIVYTSLTQSGHELELMQVWTLKDARDFIITYGSLSRDFSSYLPTIQKMIDSFAFIPATAPAASNATTPAASNATAPAASNATTPAASNATAPIPSAANQTGLNNSTQTNTNFETARNQYLAAWNQTTMHSTFDTFIEQGSASGYGVYVQHPNVFKPGDSIVLYVEPVGFAHKPVIDDKGNTLYQINLTADIIISDNQGRQLAALTDLPAGLINSHHKNTEMFLTLKVDQKTPFPIGDYKITYIVKDGSSGKSFQIVKPIKIANFVSSGIS